MSIVPARSNRPRLVRVHCKFGHDEAAGLVDADIRDRPSATDWNFAIVRLEPGTRPIDVLELNSGSRTVLGIDMGVSRTATPIDQDPHQTDPG